MSADVIALLLGRKGSKGLPGKNTLEIMGRPMAHYSAMAALESKYISDIFLTTDDDKIIEAVKEFDLNIIRRPDYLCTDEALFEDALAHGYKEVIKLRGGIKPNIVVVLMCNVITINSELIDLGVEALKNNSDADSAVTVSCLNMYSPLRARRLDEEGYLLPFVPFETFGDPRTLNCDRDSQGNVYFADMSHSVCRSRALDNMGEGLLPQRWMGNKILPIHNVFGCDIDERWQIDASIGWLEENS